MKISVEVKRNEDGSISVIETQQAIQSLLWDLVSKEETDACVVGEAVHAVFDQHHGKSLPMPAVVTYAFAQLAQNPATASRVIEDYKGTETAIRAFIKNSGQFDVSKGKGGGVKRLRDILAKE